MNINNISSCELISLASTLAIIIGKNITSDEANLLASFFSAIGNNLGIIASTTSTQEQSGCFIECKKQN